MPSLVIDSGAFGSYLAIASDNKISRSVYDSSLQTGELTLLDLYRQLTSDYSEDIESILFISGPGSYTGLRIALSFVQGLAIGLGADVYEATRVELAMRSLVGRVTNLDIVNFIFPAGKEKYILYQAESKNIKAEAVAIEDLNVFKSSDNRSYLFAGRSSSPTEESLIEISSNNHLTFSSIDQILADYYLAADNTLLNSYSPEELGNLSPSYGLAYKALKLNEQKKVFHINNKGT